MTGRVLLLTLFSVLVADQVSKHVARRALADDRRDGLVAFRLVANPRPGLVRLHRNVALALWAVAVAYSVVVVRLLDGSVIGGVAIGLAIGGATSNLVDRVTRGAVTDFVCLWRWPAFNLADVALVAAVPLAVGALL
ncbi:MAG: signal peptidase II [Actinobacteria bacterium]|nr:signal peptidase II [Actinomycetota bacterium]